MEDFVPYELAVKLKKKGFNEGCYKYYENKELKWSNSPWLETQYNNYMPHIVAAPTISQVFKWLREEKKIYIMINFWPAGYNAEIYTKIGKDKNRFDWERYIDECDYYDSYELAAIAGVEYCLDNLI